MQTVTGFWNKNKVFILALVGAIAVPIQDALTKPNIDFKILGYAVLMAALAFFAKEWRGQTASIVGILGTLANTSVLMLQGGIFTWQTFIVQGVIAVMAAFLPDPKSRGYELSQPIVAAKVQGEEINPAPLTTKPNQAI